MIWFRQIAQLSTTISEKMQEWGMSETGERGGKQQEQHLQLETTENAAANDPRRNDNQLTM
jgi:hypothetical protein